MINVCVAPVADEDEALFLMLHHLQLAAAYFEATPLEITPADIGDHFYAPAIKAWLTVMTDLYPEEEA